jgi:hypothetical protein
MSIDGMLEAWGPLFELAQDFYGSANHSLLQNEAFDSSQFEDVEPLLDEMLKASERIRRNADQVLSTALEEEYRVTSNLLLAAATVDAMLASDLATLDLEHGERRRLEISEREESPSELVYEREQSLDEVNRLFLGEERGTAAGHALGGDQSQLIEAAYEVTKKLLDLAKTPSPALLKGLAVAASGGGPEILATAQHIDVLADLKGSAAGVLNHAPRFLREHAAKMLALRTDAKVIGDVAEYLRKRVDIESLLVWVSSYDDANARNQQVIAEAPAISPEDGEALKAELAALLPDYQTQMSWIGTSAKWLKRGASPLTHLVAPFVGHAAICGVFLIGIGYVAYSLTDRIDARDLGFADRITGAVTLVASRVSPNPGS